MLEGGFEPLNKNVMLKKIGYIIKVVYVYSASHLNLCRN
jgi:hypothetical protein